MRKTIIGKLSKLAILGLSVPYLISCTLNEVNSQTQQSLHGDILIENATVIDAEYGVRKDFDVLLSERKITAVGVDLNAAVSQRIDGSGKFLIPGLWDAHVHLTYDKGVDYRTFFPLSLAYGITYLRDTGGHLDQLAAARAVAKSDMLTPDLFVSGPLIDGELRVYDGNSRPDLSVGVANAEEAVKAVNSLADQGVDFIKAYEMLSPEAFQAVVDQAKRRGLPVTSHIPLSMRASTVAQSGVAGMQHLRNLELDCVSDGNQLLEVRRKLLSSNAAPSAGGLRSSIHKAQRIDAIRNSDNSACKSLIDILAANQVAQTPTLYLNSSRNRMRLAKSSWQNTYQLLPQSTASIWLKQSIAFSAQKPTDEDKLFGSWILSMTRQLHDRNVPIMAGTDAPIALLTPGISLHQELVMLVEAGLSPIEALRAATITPATFFGLEMKQGTIAVGMKADLVMLNADPLDNIENTKNINAVIRSGTYLNRKRLDRLLKQPSGAN